MRNKALFGAVWACLLMFYLVMGFTASHPVIEPEQPSQPVRFVPDCWHLYDNWHHVEWAECMGVGYYE